jgi:hypothetical protein
MPHTEADPVPLLNIAEIAQVQPFANPLIEPSGNLRLNWLTHGAVEAVLKHRPRCRRGIGE